MALVVEDGTGLSNSNSYVSVLFVTTYLTDRANETAWLLLTTAQQEASVIKATDYIDRKYNGLWFGSQKASTQSLAWPRVNAEDIEGNIIASDSIPSQLEKAAAEAAIKASTEDLLPDLERGGSIKSEKKKVGSIEKSTEYFSGANTNKSFQAVDTALRGLFRKAGMELTRA